MKTCAFIIENLPELSPEEEKEMEQKWAEYVNKEIESFEFEGDPLTREIRALAVLVARLGGSVEITDDELEAVKGLAIVAKDGKLLISI